MGRHKDRQTHTLTLCLSVCLSLSLFRSLPLLFSLSLSLPPPFLPSPPYFPPLSPFPSLSLLFLLSPTPSFLPLILSPSFIPLLPPNPSVYPSYKHEHTSQTRCTFTRLQLPVKTTRCTYSSAHTHSQE